MVHLVRNRRARGKSDRLRARRDLLLKAAIDYKANEAIGLGGALAKLHGQPFGPWLLGAVAAGLIAFGLFSISETRYRRI